MLAECETVVAVDVCVCVRQMRNGSPHAILSLLLDDWNAFACPYGVSLFGVYAGLNRILRTRCASLSQSELLGRVHADPTGTGKAMTKCHPLSRNARAGSHDVDRTLSQFFIQSSSESRLRRTYDSQKVPLPWLTPVDNTKHVCKLWLEWRDLFFGPVFGISLVILQKPLKNPLSFSFSRSEIRVL